jgi:hypothetical protein
MATALAYERFDSVADDDSDARIRAVCACHRGLVWCTSSNASRLTLRRMLDVSP